MSNQARHAFDYEEKERRGQNHNESIVEKLKQPTSFVIIILVCVIMVLLCQFGSLQHEVQKMESKMHGLNSRVSHISNDERDEKKRMNRMQSELDKIEKEEHNLHKKENEIEDKERMLMDHDKRHEHMI